jgi:hypothetical protein
MWSSKKLRPERNRQVEGYFLQLGIELFLLNVTHDCDENKGGIAVPSDER